MSGHFGPRYAKYYGFAKNTLTDHSWKRYLYYLAYSPFKERSYVLGSVLSHSMYKHYCDSKKKLKTLLNTCSNRGSHNSLSDYAKACGIKESINTEFMINKIGEILS